MLAQVESAVATESGKGEAEELDRCAVGPLRCMTVIRTISQPASRDDGEDEG